MSYNILKNLTSAKPWLITEAAANAYLPTVMRMLRGDVIEVNEKQAAERAAKFASYNLSAQAASISQNNASAQEQYVTVIPYKDVVIKYSEACGPMGTEHFADQILQAADDTNCIGIVLDVDSPGGAGDAVQRPSEAIEYAKGKKPVVAYTGNGMAASAMYWMAAQADEIYATYTSDEVGSIGAYITLMDVNKAYSEMYGGAKVESVYASKSKAKNKGYRDWVDGDNSYLIKNDLDPFNEEFINAVKQGRGEKLKTEDVFDGRLVMAAQAVSFGLIDGLRTFASTIERVFELSNTRKNKNTAEMKVLVKGMDATVDAVNAGAEATVEQIAAANAELTARGLVLNTVADTAAAADMATNMHTLADSLNAALSAQKVAETKLAAIKADADAAAVALGLTVSEAGYLDANSDPVTLKNTADAVVAQRDTYGQQAGVLEVAATDRIESENPTESDWDKQVDARLQAGI